MTLVNLHVDPRFYYTLTLLYYAQNSGNVKEYSNSNSPLAIYSIGPHFYVTPTPSCWFCAHPSSLDPPSPVAPNILPLVTCFMPIL